MPRGGGSRGGGFRGGGIGGGGFRGGGFRGSPVSFRSSSIRSSGRPFGRTGSTRIVSRSPSGPYRHNYYRPRRHYYGYWYRPWYYRWWYSPWWSGYWYRPWYYSPTYVGGGIVVGILILLIVLPIFGVALWFPFTDANASGAVTYRSTEQIYYNEYWYEYEHIETGNDITYSIQSSSAYISFAIWNHPFEDFSRINKPGSEVDSVSLNVNGYETFWLFLRPGSSINYEFNASGLIDFFLVDAYNFNEWNNYGNPSYIKLAENVNESSGSYTVNIAKDYYLVWYNENGSTKQVDFNVNYVAADVVDFSEASLSIESVESVSQNTFTVPSEGDWYFFVYFDPMNSPEESTYITFDVTYQTGTTYADHWISASPIIIGIIVLIIIIIIIAYVARQSQKKKQLKAKTTEEPKKAIEEQPEKVQETAAPSIKKCIRCETNLKPGAKYCHNCGWKVTGRQTIPTNITTPPTLLFLEPIFNNFTLPNPRVNNFI
ncbi:MAG: zinc ribbon domain-containing protein [Candidatus Lokiarchaeota archaeon]